MLCFERKPEPWYAIYVKSRHEKHVAFALDAKGYESFLPTYTKLHKDSKKFDLPLFPNYVFCRLVVSRTLPVINTPGVFSIVGNGCTPAAIPDLAIEDIKRTLESGHTLRSWPYISSGQEVCLNTGPLRGVHGVVLDGENHKWLVISVHLLQRSVAVKLDRSGLPLGAISVRPVHLSSRQELTLAHRYATAEQA